jgi:hypothetical protein
MVVAWLDRVWENALPRLLVLLTMCVLAYYLCLLRSPSPSPGQLQVCMSSSVDHQDVLRDGCSLIVSDEAGSICRADLRMPGTSLPPL